MSNGELCQWLDVISLGQYRNVFRRIRLTGNELLKLPETELRKLIRNRFHRQHLRNSISISMLDSLSLTSLVHGSGTSMCSCEACAFQRRSAAHRLKSEHGLMTPIPKTPIPGRWNTLSY